MEVFYGRTQNESIVPRYNSGKEKRNPVSSSETGFSYGCGDRI